jgi:8-oxo-dGTP pyrophosphatase MutT (NUDIX family)
MVADRIATVLQSHSPKNLTGDHYKLAEVLVPIQERADGDHLVLTKRAEHLNHHRGQVAFPEVGWIPVIGGELAAALRESHEEIGIDPAHVRVLGRWIR